MLTVYGDTRIYVLSPTLVTGGPETLHQLVFKLNQLGYSAEIVYYHLQGQPEGQDGCPEQFLEYQCPRAHKIVDHEHNIVIVPEPQAQFLKLVKKSQKAVWWLAANHIDKHGPYESDWLHLASGYYCQTRCETHGFETVGQLSDFINAAFHEPYDVKAKTNLIAYSLKGHEWAAKIQEQAPDLNLVPLINMTYHEVAETLREAKVYIDFGPFPGRDRIPREAALCGCVMIAGQNGSAMNFRDLPIPHQYVRPIQDGYLSHVVAFIRDCLLFYEDRLWDFEAYRAWIREAETRMENEILTLFKRV